MSPKNHLLTLAVFLYLQLTAIHSNQRIDDETIQEFSVSTDGKVQEVHQRQQQPTQHPAAIGIIIKNPRPYPIKYYWWSGTASVYQGPIGPRSVTATNSYVGHEFYFTTIDRKTREESEFFRIHVVSNVNQYILPPEPGMEDDAHYVALMEEKKFVEDYFERTGIWIYCMCWHILCIYTSIYEYPCTPHIFLRVSVAGTLSTKSSNTSYVVS